MTPLTPEAAAPPRSTDRLVPSVSEKQVWWRRRWFAGRRRAGAETLRARAAATEPDFLALGAELRGLSDTAAAVARRVGDATTRLQENLAARRLAGAGGAVALAIQDMNASVAEVERCLAQLRRVSGGLAAMRPQIERIGRVGVLLQSTAVGFAVESARTAECQQAFGSFVDDIRGLSRRTRAIEDRISAELAAAHATEVGTLAELEKELTTLRELLRQGASSSERTAADVQQHMENMARALGAVREQSGRIRMQTEEAVFHLQFGDIVRQKVEHIAEALDEVAALADAATTDVAHGDGPAEAGGLDGLLGRLEEFHGLVLAAERLRNQGSESAGAAFAVAARIATEIQQVQAVNREMHLLALNAIVKTAALGMSGATLEVLSMQVHALYREADGAVATIAEQAGLLEAESAAGSVAPQAARLAATVGQVRGDATDFARTMGEMRAGLSAGRGQLGRAQDRLATLTAYAAALRGLRQQLATARASLAPWRAAGVAAAAVMEDRYTMESERAVHRQIAERGPAAVPVAIEVASTESAKADAKESDTGPHDAERRGNAAVVVADLGDNVELF